MNDSVPRFFRVRVELETTAPVKLHAHHAAAIYSLLAAANGRGREAPAALPDGMMIDSPEQCRVRIRAGERYAFGFTLLASPEAAADVLQAVLKGLADLATTAGSGHPAWGGNYRVVAVEDLVAGGPWDGSAPLVPIAPEALDEEAAQVAGLRRLTLRFGTPFRRRRLAAADRPGHSFFDRAHFDPDQFAGSLWTRLGDLGLVSDDRPASRGLAVADNRLVWLDISYGVASERKRLGGAVGRVVLDGLTPAWARPLVLGQYARTGANTRFGFGAYRIDELGPDRFACSRSIGLLDLALANPALDRAAEQADLPAGRLRHLVEQLRAGTYRPGPSVEFEIPRPDGAPRRICVPAAEDRVLQRAVLDQLAPGLDPFFEDSSFAYRRGLSRHGAARALAGAWAEGFRWAVRADMHEFFDAIGHGELRERLDAYLADESLCDQLMKWVRAGAPFPDRGLPTGAPLSPLLANLFLDGFDERVAADGGRLIRYADDLLILSRTRAEADRLLAAARAAAAEVELALNGDKTAVISLREPFEFVGFRFEWKDRWEAGPGPGVVALEDLGWTDAASPYAGPVVVRLPGEPDDPVDDGGLLVAGPGRYPVAVRGDRIVCGEGDPPPGAEIARLEAVVLIGDPDLSALALRALAARGVPVFVTDSLLRDPVALVGDAAPDDPAAVAGQLRLLEEGALRLALARPLVAAKLRNSAALADAVPGRRADVITGQSLRTLAERAATAADFEELLGLEGTGARLWFDALADRLPHGWPYPRRVAPCADDPVNVLLNIAYTFLHRWAYLAVRSAGLLPTVGILHRPRPGHAALASDLQEPFRHLMDRAVLELAVQLRPTDFQKTPRGRFPLTLLPHASQQVAATLARALRRGVAAAGESEAKSYRRHLVGLARGLRRTLADPAAPWPIFLQPG